MKCREPDCITQLSRFNPGDRCWNHTDYTLPERNLPTSDRGRQEVCSDAFLLGCAAAYELTAGERERYHREWGAEDLAEASA
jgi:hypothetical protein